jgi:hypothetical protein
MSVYGGFASDAPFLINTGSNNQGLWSESPNCPKACFINGSRLLNATYYFDFNEDLTKADITPMMNPCCCVPCLPAWLYFPKCLYRFNMERVMSTRKTGSKWIRNSACLCSKFYKSYELVEVFNKHGQPGEFHHLLNTQAPEVIMVSR